MKTPELGWRGKGQVSHCGASGTDKWVFAQPCPPGLQANQDPLADLCGPLPGGWILSPSNRTGSQPCPCFLPLWVGQAGSWLCGVPWSPGSPGDGAGEVGVLPGWDWRGGWGEQLFCSSDAPFSTWGPLSPHLQMGERLVHTTPISAPHPSGPTMGSGKQQPVPFSE